MDTVRKLMEIIRNRKGIAVVYIALILVVLIAFVGFAIDFGYMYVAKGQLQNAADAAALAGAVKLAGSDTSSNDLKQPEARQAAWEFACKNKAAGENVYIDDSSNPNPSDCDSNININQLNDSNSDTGNIVVGNWNVDSRTFTRATGSTLLPINAIIVKTARTSASRGGKVGVFFGGVLSPVFKTMAAATSAGAMQTYVSIFALPLCNLSCGTTTPLGIVSPNATPGARFYLRAGDDPTVGKTQTTAWTAFFDNTSRTNVGDYIRGIKQPPNICNQCIQTNNGQVVPASCDMLDVINRYRRTYPVVDGDGTIHQISGIKGLLPILNPASSVCASGANGCIGDPGAQNATNSGLYQVFKYAEVIITDSIPQGNNCKGTATTGGAEGIVMVGTAPGPAGTNSSAINCVDCTTPPSIPPSIGSVLFK